MSIHYDYERNYAKAQITEGYEEGKTYIRRYDKVRSPLMDSLILYWRSPFQKNEYMIVAGEYPECQRSYLGCTLIGKMSFIVVVWSQNFMLVMLNP